MTNDLYVAASGLLLTSRQLDAAAHNLANVETPGFRARQIFAETIGNVGAGPTVGSLAGFGGQFEPPGPGPLRQTADPWHVALLDEGLLTVQTPEGLRYTRAGGMTVDADGRLVHASGHPVVDVDGFPVAAVDELTTLAEDGAVYNREGILVARLGIVRDEAKALVPAGGSLLTVPPGGPAPADVDEPRLMVGWIEDSTSDPFTEIVRMIEVQRSFERLQRVVSQNMNEVTRRAVNDIAG